MTMIEKMARALAGHFGKSFDDMALDRSELRALVRNADGYDINEPTQADCLEAARGALTVLLEPDKATEKAGDDAWFEASYDTADCKLIFTAMIWKILSEPDETAGKSQT